MNTFVHRCSDPLVCSQRGRPNRAGVFFDRDGTLIEEKHYLDNIAALRFFPGIASGLRKLSSLGLSLYLFTNQAGVAHGYFNEHTLAQIHRYFLDELHRVGVSFRGILYCPHHPTAEIESYRCDCFGRKPQPGLLFQAALRDMIDLGQSYVVGDKLIDIEAGKKAGTKTILVLTGYGRQETARITDQTLPDHIAVNISEAVMWIAADIHRHRMAGGKPMSVSVI